MKVVFLILSLCFSFQLSAASVNREANGTVQLYAVTGKMIVKLSGSNSTCGNRYYFTPDTDYNRALLSMLLAAQMANKKVWVNGEGECKTSYPYNNAYELKNMTIWP